MPSLYLGLGLWNLGVFAGAGALGWLAHGRGSVEPRLHVLAGLFAAFFACLVHSILMAHFIGTMKWIQQTGPRAGLADTKALRTAWVRSRAFVALLVAMGLSVATGILGGGAVAGAVGGGLHLGVAIAAFAANALAHGLGTVEARRQSARVREVAGLARERERTGAVEAPDPRLLLPESGRAGGRVLLYLAGSVWGVYVYARFVLRHADEPWVPYAVASALLAGLGLSLLRSPPE
jgi:hypothetical protein